MSYDMAMLSVVMAALFIPVVSIYEKSKKKLFAMISEKSKLMEYSFFNKRWMWDRFYE